MTRIVIGILLVSFLFAVGCNRSGESNQYKGVGVVKAVNPKAPSIEIDHQDIDGAMPAMQMEFPVADARLLNGLAVNDRIDFTLENTPEGFKVVAIKKRQ